MRFKVDFVHAALSLGGCGQACPDMPKKDFKTLISQKLMEL